MISIVLNTHIAYYTNKTYSLVSSGIVQYGAPLGTLQPPSGSGFVIRFWRGGVRYF